MKYFIASDIHGSAYYCKKMLEAWEKEEADRIVFLGDILYHGPRNPLPEAYNPKEVAAMLNPLADRIFCVRGNCDSEVDQMVLDFPILAEYCLIAENGHTVFITHGHHYNLDSQPLLQKGDVLLHGHTHVPACTSTETFIYLNPGSVSLPKADSHHSYMILENGMFQWKTLNGEVYNTYTIEKRIL